MQRQLNSIFVFLLLIFALGEKIEAKIFSVKMYPLNKYLNAQFLQLKLQATIAKQTIFNLFNASPIIKKK